MIGKRFRIPTKGEIGAGCFIDKLHGITGTVESKRDFERYSLFYFKFDKPIEKIEWPNANWAVSEWEKLSLDESDVEKLIEL